MPTRTPIVGGLILLGAAGAAALFLLDRTSREPETEPVEITSRSPARGATGGPGALPGSPDAISNGGAESVDRPLRAAMDEILARFDAAWAAPLELQGEERFEALRRRNDDVVRLAREVAALGDGVVGEIRARLAEGEKSHPRRLLFAKGLRDLATDPAIRLLAEAAASRERWIWRDQAFRHLLAADNEGMPALVIETMPLLEDPRFLLPALLPDASGEREPLAGREAEQAYGAWYAVAESLPRNQSYNYLIRVEGGWVQPIYEQAAADEKRPVTERAGAVQAMATRGEEGALGFLEGLLWRTKDETLIRAIIAAIKRLGDEEARAILESYATGGAPTPEIAEYAMRVATAPKPRTTPLDGTGEGGEGGPSIQARPISPEELPGIRPR